MSTSRIFGLSGSGMDIDQMVKDLMVARRASYDKVWQKKTQLEWKKADYSAMHSTLREFRSSTAFNYKLQGTVQPKTVSSSAENVISATANSDAVNVSHDITVTQLAEGARLASSTALGSAADKTSLSTQFGLAAGTYDIVLNNGAASKTIQVDTSKSINDFVSSINSAAIGIKASYDTNLDRFFMTTTATGSPVEINFGGTTGEDERAFLTDKLKLNIASSPAGKDAIFNLDGATDLTQSSNTFAISGVAYKLKAIGTTTVNVASDDTKAVSAVKSFVESYNAMLDKVNKEIKEEKYSDYKPLTSVQKKEMSETEIADWEKFAKSGTLRRDSILQDTVSRLRSDMSTSVSSLTGNYRTLASIGITSGDYTEGGKLYLDEDKLKGALQADPEVISKLFSTAGATSSQQGVAVRLYDTLKTSMDKIAATAGYSGTIDDDSKSALAKQIISYNKSLTVLNDKLEETEKRYYKQYSAMEAALNKLNQQSSWMSQQFSQ